SAHLPAVGLVHGPRERLAGRYGLCAACHHAAVHRPHRRRAARVPAEEREGGVEGGAGRPGASPCGRRSEIMNLMYVSIAFFAMLALMLIGMPIATSMAAIGVIG